jgi:hypothetical protein
MISKMKISNILKENLNGSYDFSSIQFQYPGEFSSKVLEFSNNKIVDDKLYFEENDDSYGRENDIHTTVLYGIQSNNPNNSTKVLKNKTSFVVKLGPISKFSNEKYDVLHITVKSRELEKIHDSLRMNIKNSYSYDEYKPHITIAYVKNNSCDSFLGNTMFQNQIFRVFVLFFINRNGKKYPIELKTL